MKRRAALATGLSIACESPSEVETQYADPAIYFQRFGEEEDPGTWATQPMPRFHDGVPAFVFLIYDQMPIDRSFEWPRELRILNARDLSLIEVRPVDTLGVARPTIELLKPWPVRLNTTPGMAELTNSFRATNTELRPYFFRRQDLDSQELIEKASFVFSRWDDATEAGLSELYRVAGKEWFTWLARQSGR